LTATGEVTGNQITSTVATGTAPLVVTSTTPVANLSIGGNAATATLASTVTTNANLTGPITSAGNVTSVASQTGIGTKFVMDDSPTLITPNLGVASATSLTAHFTDLFLTRAILIRLPGSFLQEEATDLSFMGKSWICSISRSCQGIHLICFSPVIPFVRGRLAGNL